MRNAVAALGLCSWDRLLVVEHYPGPGEYAIVSQAVEQAGGTTGNSTAALARLGVEVTLVSYVGVDRAGSALVEAAREAGVDVTWVGAKRDEPTDSGMIVVSGPAGQRERTIYWLQGAKPVLGDHLPVDEMLAHQWVLLDIDDPRLRSFFLDLPAHRSPRTKLAGTMTYLVEMEPADGWQHVLRHDVVCGNERELLTLTSSSTWDDAVAFAQREMVGTALRVLYLSRGAAGSVAIRPTGIVQVPAFEVDVVDTTGAGDAFTAGCLWGLIDRLADEAVLLRGNALGGLSCRSLGARIAQPTRDEALALIATRDGMP